MRSTMFVAVFLALLVAAQNNQGGNSQGGNGQGENDDNQGDDYRDICVIGGGASGMGTAFMAKDNGYSVVVLEKKNYAGGHCKTTHFTPQTPGGVNYVDLGVQLFPDTRKARAQGIFPQGYALNITDIVQRFAGNDSVIYRSFAPSGKPEYLVDINPPFDVPVQPSQPSTAFTQALGRLFFLLISEYPWLSSPGYPDPIPSALLIPMSDWVLINNFTILVPLLQELTDNLGDYNTVPAVYILGIVSPVVLNFFVTPNTGFGVKGGCSQIYAGITSYLGHHNVVLNAQVTSVVRPQSKYGRVSISGTANNQPFEYTCGSVVTAFPQTTSNFGSAWTLDSTEQAVFSQISVRNYWWGTANVTGNGLFNASNGFQLLVRNLTGDPFLTPPYPTLIQLARNDTNQQPAAWYAASGTNAIGDDAIRAKVNQDFGVLENLQLIGSAVITDFNYHQYQPFVTNVTALATSPTLYTQIANLQGHRQTYYVGAALTYAGTYIVWEHAYNLVQTYFPPQH